MFQMALRLSRGEALVLVFNCTTLSHCNFPGLYVVYNRESVVKMERQGGD